MTDFSVLLSRFWPTEIFLRCDAMLTSGGDGAII